MIEVLMSLALTGFVIMMGFSVLQIFQHGHQRYRQKVDRCYTQSILLHQLAQDVLLTRSVERLPAPLRGIQLMSRQDSMWRRYHWTDSLLCYQRNELRDTFALRGNFSYVPDSALLIWHDSSLGLEYRVYHLLESAARARTFSPPAP